MEFPRETYPPTTPGSLAVQSKIDEAIPSANEASPCDGLDAAARAMPAVPLTPPRRHRDSSDEPPYKAPPQSVRRILVDHREARSGVPSALASHPNVRVTLQHLSLGDYRVDDCLVVERKTLADFARSVRDGRLFAQVSRLARVTRGRPCLILEGTRVHRPSAALPRSALQGALITVTLVFGLPLLRSSGPDETARLVLYAADQLHRRPTRPPRRDGYRPRGLRCLQNLLLQTVPGIGPARADLLLDTFGSPVAVASTTVEDLCSVEGIGSATAAGIHRLFHGK